MRKRLGDDVKKQQLKKVILTVVLISASVFLLLLLLGTFAQAAGLVDDTVSEDNLYSKYALDHYQLDFYVECETFSCKQNIDTSMFKRQRGLFLEE